MNKYYFFSITFLIGLGCGMGLMHKLIPYRTEVVTKIEQQERVVVKERTVKAPDGTIITDVTRTEARNTQQQAVLRESVYMPDYKAGIGYDTAKAYTATLERRLAGPLFIGASYRTTGQLGLTLSIEF